MANFCDGCAPTRREGESVAHQRREPRLDLLVAPAQRVIVRVRNRRRIVLVVALVVLADLGREPLELGLGLRLGEIVDGDVAAVRELMVSCEHCKLDQWSGVPDSGCPPGLDDGIAHPAALIRRSAAARASAVISAPASMRAISSRRLSAASSATRVATRLPLSSALLLMR